MSETDERQQLANNEKETTANERQLSDNDSASAQALEEQLKQTSEVANFSNRLGTLEAQAQAQFSDPLQFQEPKVERQFDATNPFQYYHQPPAFHQPFYQPGLMQIHPTDQFQHTGFAAHALMTAQNPAPQTRATTKSSTTSTESQPRRLSHNTAEKRRRDKINEGIQELCVLLPPNEDGRKSNNKAVILSRSVEYIRHLEMQYQHLIERHRHLSGENLQLKQFRASLPTLQQQQVFMGAPTPEMPQGSS